MYVVLTSNLDSINEFSSYELCIYTVQYIVCYVSMSYRRAICHKPAICCTVYNITYLSDCCCCKCSCLCIYCMYSRVNLGSCEVVAVLGVNIVDGELALQLLLPPLRPLATLHTVKRTVSPECQINQYRPHTASHCWK